MKIFYFTFGANQKHNDELMEGKCQPIMAENEKIATAKMREIYGTCWCMCYTQEKWDKIPYDYKEKALDMIIVNRRM